MNFYNFAEIKEKGSCVKFAETFLNVIVAGGRCSATWRGGERDSVAIDDQQWYDHVEKVGGGLLELCALTKFGGTTQTEIQQAQEFLGNWLGLEPMNVKIPAAVASNQYEKLLADGYAETARYHYLNADGTCRYYVVRMFNQKTGKKEFVQGHDGRWGIAGVEPILYNLPSIIPADTVIVVEGEKDVETLREIGSPYPGTTNSGGAEKWQENFRSYFAGKRVFIVADNDTAGNKHAYTVAAHLHGTAREIRICTVSALQKGDVTDYIRQEGGTLSTLLQKLESAPVYNPEAISGKLAAKLANSEPFRNYRIDESGKRKERSPRQINELIEDLHTRLLGAPYRVGDLMFDRDQDSGDINYMYDAADLFSWIARKTRTIVDWSKIDGTVTKSEFFAALRSEAPAYQGISHIPDFPLRRDVFYAHDQLPAPSEGHKIFWDFVEFFNPATEESKSVIASFIMAPIFFAPGVDKPLFIIDSVDGQGSGKSTIPTMTAKLYGSASGVGGEVIDTSLYDLDKNYDEVVKRVISAEGRNARIFRIDNVIGNLKSANLSRMVTMASISGRASYGRGEESRPNNLTYVATVNGAVVDTDIASRAFYIMLKKPKMSPTWKRDIFQYIEDHRMEIFADIIDMLERHQFFPGCEPVTRTPEFEYRVLQPACKTKEQYLKVIEYLQQNREDTNEDEEIANRIQEELYQQLNSGISVCYGAGPINPKTDRIFIRSTVLEHWFSGATWLDNKRVSSAIRNLAKTGKLNVVEPKIRRYPHHPKEGQHRFHGIMWNMSTDTDRAVRIIDLVGKKVVEITEGKLA